jgi:hypothetical protein
MRNSQLTDDLKYLEITKIETLRNLYQQLEGQRENKCGCGDKQREE